MSLNRIDTKSSDYLSKLRDELAANRAASLAGKEITPQLLVSDEDALSLSDDFIISADSASTFYITEFEPGIRFTDAHQLDIDTSSGILYTAVGAGGFLNYGYLGPGRASGIKNRGSFIGRFMRVKPAIADFSAAC